MSELQFQQIPLKDITPDPNQPRKFYDEQSMQDLTDSVRESGVLQPILVRKKAKGKGYLLVCGERRYRASVAVQTAFKTRDTIPAVIRELSDEEALQLQIVENLQRKDVHPMEEAVGFKSFIEGKNWSFEEIAKRCFLKLTRQPSIKCVGSLCWMYYLQQRVTQVSPMMQNCPSKSRRSTSLVYCSRFRMRLI